MFYSKQEILEAYFNLAPYGMNNIEGIAAAAQIYFETVPEKLNRDQIMHIDGWFRKIRRKEGRQSRRQSRSRTGISKTGEKHGKKNTATTENRLPCRRPSVFTGRLRCRILVQQLKSARRGQRVYHN